MKNRIFNSTAAMLVLAFSGAMAAAPAAAEEWELGIVKWFNPTKGFGFITRTNGQEVFVHHTVLDLGCPLVEGLTVFMTVTQGQKGLQAGYVRCQ